MLRLARNQVKGKFRGSWDLNERQSCDEYYHQNHYDLKLIRSAVNKGIFPYFED